MRRMSVGFFRITGNELNEKPTSQKVGFFRANP